MALNAVIFSLRDIGFLWEGWGAHVIFMYLLGKKIA